MTPAEQSKEREINGGLVREVLEKLRQALDDLKQDMDTVEQNLTNELSGAARE